MTAYTDFHYSPTGSGVISGSQVLEQTEQGINGLGQYVQDNISGAIDTANQALTIAQTANTNATTALNTANSFSDAITTANQTANNALTTAQSAQSTANAASSLATTANNNATSALNAANAATSNVNILTSTVNGLGNRMTAAENAISANAGNITTLQNNLATTNTNVTAAANAASSAQATATSAQATATSAKNAAYVLRYTGTTITGGATIAYADIDNTDNIKAGDKIIDISGAIYAIASVDIANETVTVGASPVINLFCDAENLIPAANNAYDLGSSSYQWNNLYAKGYYYNGVAWGLDKANTWTENQTISANSAKSVAIKNTSYTLGEATPSSEKTLGAYQFWDSNGVNAGFLSLAQFTNGDVASRWLVRFKYTNGVKSTTGTVIDSSIENGLTNSGDRFLRPVINNYVNLGDSTHKWKTLNGINPGALSLPDYSKASNIDTTNWNKNGTLTSYTPTMNGWLQITLPDDADNNGKYTNKIIILDSTAPNPITGQASATVGDIRIYLTYPVIANRTYSLYIKSYSNTITAARFIPCQGNV